MWAGDYAADWVDEYAPHTRKPTPSGLFAHLAAQWKREFTTHGFARGCPIMATAADFGGIESSAAALCEPPSTDGTPQYPARSRTWAFRPHNANAFPPLCSAHSRARS